MTRAPRVLMLVANFTYPDDGRVRRESRTLVEAGYDVTVVCPRGENQARRETVRGVHVRRYRLPEGHGGAAGFVIEHVYAMLASLVISLRLASTRGVDVVHVHNPPDLLVVVGMVFKVLGKRFVYDHHDLAPELYRARFQARTSRLVFGVLTMLEQMCCRFADHVIEPNESHAELDNRRRGVPLDRITVVRNGPELELLRRLPPDETLREEATGVICYVGTIGPQDGVDHLLRALRSLLDDPTRSGIRCYIVGHGDAVPALQALAGSLGISENVRFVGRVPVGEVARYISVADICVEPAPTNDYNDRCTMIKIMEYMALGKAVVAFDLPEHYVTAGPAALLVPPNDDAAFGKAIGNLLDDPAEREALGAAGRERVEQHLAWHRIAPSLLDAYRKIVEEIT